MKKAFTIFLVLINIVIMFGLLGLVGYQFTEIVKKNSQVEDLKTSVKDLKEKQKQISTSGSISQPTQTPTQQTQTPLQPATTPIETPKVQK
jgi:biopolymer transport protein ExbB/TolQ